MSDHRRTATEDTEECQKPCHPDFGCRECAEYWARMAHEGFWDSEKHCWTDKGFREMTK